MSAIEPQAVVPAPAGRLEEVIEAQRGLLARATDPDATLTYAAELACRITGCETAAVFVQEGDWFVRKAVCGRETRFDARVLGKGNVIGLCYRSGEMQMGADTHTDPRCDQELVRRMGVRSFVAVPLISSRAVEGVLRAGSPRPNAFSLADAQLMQVVGGLIGATLELAAVFQRAQRQTDETWAALEQSSRSEQTHRTLFEENPTPMYICDPVSLTILRANAAADALYGYAPGELVGLPLLNLVREQDHDRLRGALDAAAERIHAGIWRQVRKNGRELVAQVVSRAFDLEGRAARLVIVNDETERRRAEDELAAAQHQLLQADKMASVGQLAAGVAHEINNPIGYVYSNLGTLATYLEDLFSVLDLYQEAEGALPVGSPLLERIQGRKRQLDLTYLREDLTSLMVESREGITRVKKIVQDLKDFSHADTKDDWQTVELHKGIDSTLNIVHNELKYTCTVVKEYGELPEIECLPSQLNQVFMNLLVNAAHSIQDKGTITVRTGMRAEEVWIEVSDTGCGIPKENLKRIFDPFFTTKPIGKGTGLGLSLAYGIVKKHGGRFEVESELGKGSTFCVSLPQRRPMAAAA